MRMLPPLPPDSVYTRNYCEENVYLLCKTFCSQPEISESWSIHIVFVSNENKTVALWTQKAGGRDRPVVWDYHVILILKPIFQDGGDNAIEFDSLAHPESIVYDFDTTLSMPCSWGDYFSCTFLDGLPSNYQSKFRVVLGEMFVKYFASDRSHMVKTVDEIPDELGLEEEPSFRSPPPAYPPIRGQSAIDNGMDHNLMSHYVDMLHADDSGAYGRVYGYEDFLDFFGDCLDQGLSGAPKERNAD